DVQLGHAFARHEPTEEAHELVGPLHLNVEIRVGEAEDDAEVVFIQQQRVDDDAIGRVHQGDGQRQRSASGPDTADQVGALVAVEDRHEHYGTLDRAFL